VADILISIDACVLPVRCRCQRGNGGRHRKVVVLSTFPLSSWWLLSMASRVIYDCWLLSMTSRIIIPKVPVERPAGRWPTSGVLCGLAS